MATEKPDEGSTAAASSAASSEASANASRSKAKAQAERTAKFEAALAFLERMPEFVSHSKDEAVAILNGAIGDRLEAEGSPLATKMQMRERAGILDVTAPLSPEDGNGRKRSGHLAVLVHGLMANERYWAMGTDAPFAERLEDAFDGGENGDDLVMSAVLVRYNTGRHISENGRELSEMLDALVAQWPVEVESISLIGHSMGGLVSRSAAHYGAIAARDAGDVENMWFPKLRRQFLIGVPSRGAPLEILAHIATFTLKAIPNPWTLFIGWAAAQRSAGIKDLRHGYLVDEEWTGRNPDAPSFGRKFPPQLPPDVAHFVIASTLAESTKTPLGKILGDALVIPWSAKDTVAHGARGEKLAADVKWIPNMVHARLGWSPLVRDQVLAWIVDPTADISVAPSVDVDAASGTDVDVTRENE